MFKYLFIVFAILLSINVQAQNILPPSATILCPVSSTAGSASIVLSNGSTATVVCQPFKPCSPPLVLSGGQCVQPTPPPTNNPQACTVGTPSDNISGRTLTRVCDGNVLYVNNTLPKWFGPLDQLTDILSAPTPEYNYAGLANGVTFIVYLSTGTYASFEFTAPAGFGEFQFNINKQYGDFGTVSLSTVPGQFMPYNPNVICSNTASMPTPLVVGSPQNSTPECRVTPGQKYYVNIADIDRASGRTQCFTEAANGTCSISQLAYTLLVSKATNID